MLFVLGHCVGSAFIEMQFVILVRPSTTDYGLGTIRESRSWTATR